MSAFELTVVPLAIVVDAKAANMTNMTKVHLKIKRSAFALELHTVLDSIFVFVTIMVAIMVININKPYQQNVTTQ